ncbi:hypothetical protein [Bacteroides pyogenes]|uniref:hypothetical protein n=2 Tax=Bacteria TaxID=2 RepID=UPI002A910595|nr:hypothetical protein [Bacteroides pyogenes]MDY5434558.1 hypothetical protein [Bacteroides pyogenes]
MKLDTTARNVGGYHMKQLKTAVIVIDMQADYIVEGLSVVSNCIVEKGKSSVFDNLILLDMLKENEN